MAQDATQKQLGGASSTVKEIARLVNEITGVQLGDRQRTMVETRLKKRMIELGIKDESEYITFLQANRKTETDALVSLLTTHHTFFFREFTHFQYLEKEGLPRILKSMKARGETVLRIWSAACSNGQEVYSLSMFLQHTLARMAPGVTYQILGTDVAPQSVATAKNGVYAYKEIKEIPLHFLSNHWTKGTGEISEFVRANQSIKAPCSFEVLNLLNIGTTLGKKSFDLIFCRNVFIYFTPAQIKTITNNLLSHLLPDGVLIIGVSESLNGLNLPLLTVGPSTYIHKASVDPSAAAKVTPIRGDIVLPLAGTPETKPAVLRVLCVDDSPSILTLLRQVLKKEHGFEVVGTAVNGKDAMEKIKTLDPDVVTLDIHMPEMDGITYLQKNITKDHPPVVMISSVSRDSSDLALKALELGATDYVEKPALSNLEERAAEIRIKLSYACQNRKTGVARAALTLDQSFSKLPTIKNPDKKIRIVVAGLQDRQKLQAVLRGFLGPQPPTVVLMEGSETALPSLVTRLQKEIGKPVELFQPGGPTALKPGQVYVGDFGKVWDTVFSTYSKYRSSVLVYGLLSNASTSKLAAWPKGSGQILIEDIQGVANNAALLRLASDQVPATSFAYMSSEFLGLKDD